MGHDVFISYATPDKRFADAICATLERQSIRCWVAPRDVRPGILWAAAIVEAIAAARLMILVVSDSSGQSSHVLREVGKAADANLIIIPFRVDGTKPAGALQYYLGSMHWLDAMVPPLEAHLERLAGVAAELLSSGRVHAPAPSVPLPVRVTVHVACFATSRKLHCFINVTNLRADIELEITHVWMEAAKQIFACPADRPLPRRLRPQESWETWIAVEDLGRPDERPSDLFRAARVRISTGDVVESVENVGVPTQGHVPGGIFTPPQ